MKRIVPFSSWVLLLFLAVAQHAPAQLTRGVLSGTVHDASGGVVSGAHVTITRSVTGLKRDAVTNSVGIFRIAALEAGVYSLEFTARGFDSVKLEPVQVDATHDVVVNQMLSISKAVTAIEVTEVADTAVLTKASPAIGMTLPGSFVQSVPLTGSTRDVT